MAEIEYREYRTEDAASFLRLHDSAFPEMAPDFWREFSSRDVTAAVAILDGEIVGTVPFQFRDFRVRPGVIVRVAWEFSVCVREDRRGTGVGSCLMTTAKNFLPDRCLAMAVYRNDETSAAYRYYARNGHNALIYLRPWSRSGQSDITAAEVSERSWEDFLGHEAEYLDVFADACRLYAGFPERHPGYYARAVMTPQYGEIPLDLSVLECRDSGGALSGYAIIGVEQGAPTQHLMEIAVRGDSPALALPLLTEFVQAAAARGCDAVVSTLDSSAISSLLPVLGFAPQSRAESSMVIMAHVVDPEGFAQQVWRESEGTRNLDVVAWTPQREVVLHRAAGGCPRRVVLEMKEDALARLLFGRLDLVAAFRQGIVTALGGGAREIAAIADALPFSAWTYHYLDFA